MKQAWRWLSAIAILAAAGAVSWWQAGPLVVTVVAPVLGPAVEAVYATGTVEPSVMLPIAPRQASYLIELNADEGHRVRKGQVLARLDDTDLRKAVEELAARERYARTHFERIKQLAERHVIAQIELDRARADLEAAEAAWKRANALRGFMTLTAPADGLIIRRDGEIGQFIPVGQPIFYLSCCAPLRVTAEVDEEDIPRVRVGQKALLRADALPERVFDGQVSEITPKGDPVARSYRVRLSLAEPAQLKVGMTVDANLIVSERSGALLVPSNVIQDGAVWLVDHGRLRRQPVRIGVTGAGRTEIIEGLTPEARIVEMPTDRLRVGRAVRVQLPQPPAPVS